MLKSILIGTLLLITFVFNPGVWASPRVALVIGNSDYQGGKLSNPVNDADDMAQALSELGFTVDKIKNATQFEMEQAIQAFGDKLTEDAIAVFYYAGHAVEVNGRNYLLPIGSNIRKEHYVKYKAVDLGLVLDGFRSTNKGLNLAILDACRDNPLERSFRNNVRGLAQVGAPSGSIIAYATAPGSVAAEGTGRNGVYTHHLLKHLKTPDLEVSDLLRRVAADVKKATRNKQRPWLASDYTGQFAFVGDALDEYKLYVAVLDFEGKKLKQEEEGSYWIVRHLLERELPKTGRFRVFDRSDQLQDVVDELRLEGSELIDESQVARELKRLYKVSGVISGEIIGFGTDVFITAKLTKTTGEVQSGDVSLARSQLTVQGMKQVIPQLAAQLAGQASAPVDPVPEPPGTVWKDPKLGMEFVKIKGGCYQMGSPLSEAGRYGTFSLPLPDGSRDSDERQHRVCVDDFWMGKYEVTFAQYDRFVTATGHKKPRHWRDQDFEKRKSEPVSSISWDDAVAFAKWLTEQTGYGFRLPTEAEWEYAARAGTTTARYWGDNPDQACQYENVVDNKYEHATRILAGWTRGTPHNCNDGYYDTAPVGSFKPNGYGLHDMLGNVREWTCSEYDSDYGGAEKRCASRESSSLRATRGGSWHGKPTGGTVRVRSAYRGRDSPGFHDGVLGFRLLRTK